MLVIKRFGRRHGPLLQDLNKPVCSKFNDIGEGEGKPSFAES